MSFRACHRDAILYHFSSHFSLPEEHFPRGSLTLTLTGWFFSDELSSSLPCYFSPTFFYLSLIFSPRFPPFPAFFLSPFSPRFCTCSLALSPECVCAVRIDYFKNNSLNFPLSAHLSKSPSPSTFYTPQDTFFSAPCKKYWIFSSENEISSIFGRGRITNIGTWFCLAAKWRIGHGVCPTLRAPRARQFFNPVKLIDQKIIFFL